MDSLKQLGSGSSSNAYLKNDKVVRKPCSGVDVNEWLKAADKECLITEKLQHTECIVPQSTLINRDFDNRELVSPFFEGKPLDEQTYINLSPEKQKTLSSAFADFLYKLHHLQERPFTDDYYTSGRFIRKLKNVSLPNDLNDILYSITDVVTQDKRVQRQTGLCHNDLIKDNILFNERQNKLGIIDFGDADFGSVYRDFGSLCRPMQLGIKFTKDVVDSYNEMCKKENQSEIDFALVKQVSVLRAFEKLRNCEENDLESKFNQLREFYRKLFPKETNPTAECLAKRGNNQENHGI